MKMPSFLLLLVALLFTQFSFAQDKPGVTTAEVEEIFQVVSKMPLFPGCEDIAQQREQQECAQNKMLEYLYDKVKYPAEAKANDTRGMVVIRFVVSKEGNIEKSQIIRDIGDGCGAAVLEAVKTMPQWSPGKDSEGNIVPVYFNLPFKFKADQREEEDLAEEDEETSEEAADTPELKTAAAKEAPAEKKKLTEPQVEEIFQVVGDMPRFPGCEDMTKKAKRQECAQEKMLQFVEENLQYPAEAKAEEVEGTVVVRFIVDVDGKAIQPDVVHNKLGEAFAKEAIRIVEIMPAWKPGKQRNTPVKTYFNLPIKFKP